MQQLGETVAYSKPGKAQAVSGLAHDPSMATMGSVLYSDKEEGFTKCITEWRDIIVPLLTLFSGPSLSFKMSFQIWNGQVQSGNE